MGKSAKELAQGLNDPIFRRKFGTVTDLLHMLGDCTIPNDYSVPDDLASIMPLTETGSRMKDRLVRKEHVPAKEAHLMCALTLEHDELYLDIENVGENRLVKLIDGQITASRLRFPYMFGRHLYDAYGSTFEEEKDVLTLEETLKLIDQVPSGVFQYGKYTIGPYGVIPSKTERHIREYPKRRKSGMPSGSQNDDSSPHSSSYGLHPEQSA